MNESREHSEIYQQYEREHMLDSLRKGSLAVSLPGHEVTLGEKLGIGGTKTVYDAHIDGTPVALGLPNVIYDNRQVLERWSWVEKEPENTRRLRELGLLTNSVCELLPTKINGVSFPTLEMSRYADLPFTVLDPKNPVSLRNSPLILPSENVTQESITEFFAAVIPDLLLLINNNVQVPRESMYVCIEEQKPRVFLHDLGKVAWNNEIPEVSARYYTDAIIKVFGNSLTEDVWEKNTSFLERNLGKEDDPSLRRSLLNTLLEQVTR